MATHDKAWSPAAGEPATRAEFCRIAGISPELAAFLDAFAKESETFRRLPPRRRREIEIQMDSVLAQFGWK